MQGTVGVIDRGRGTVDERVVDALLECVARWGVAKTTVDDVARAAGLSRATVYRAFPGGKEVALQAAVRRELDRFFTEVGGVLAAAETLEDLLVVGASEAASFLLGHDALGTVLAHEPALVLPSCAFHRLDPALAAATAFVAPHLARFVDDPERAAAGAEWLVRVLLSYALSPSPAVVLTDPDSVRRFVRTYAIPVLTP